MLFLNIISILCILSCTSMEVNLEQLLTSSEDWWKNAVFYQIYPRSFKDSNNDGVGDLQGVISKLEHLKGIGVTAVWLSPIYKSPQVDQGYDISDYRDIHEEYGTLRDFDELIVKAKGLGLKVVMDFVPNHSSNQHEWFSRSERREPGYEDFYVWRDPKENGKPPNNWLSSFKYSAWEYSPIREQYYLHIFGIEQPDLNFNNPEVVQEMKEILLFWLDRGVDGFRVDAVIHLFETGFEDEPPSGNPNFQNYERGYHSHIYTEDQPETYRMVYQWRELLDNYTLHNGGDTIVMMTEASVEDLKKTMLYFGNGSHAGAHFSFNFLFLHSLAEDSTARDIVVTIKKWLAYMPLEYTPNWLIGNHDNHRVATRFGVGNIDGFNMLVMLLPGVAITYNGEEIGQENGEVTWEQGADPRACNGREEDFNKSSRDFERTPFHWDNSINAGFNEGAEPWLPVSEKYKENNLAAQEISRSHYNIYRGIIKLRQEAAFIYGKLKIEAVSDCVLAFTREITGGSAYIIIFNICDVEDHIDLTLFKSLTPKMQVVLSSVSSTREKGDLIVVDQSLVMHAHESIVAVTTSEDSADGCGSENPRQILVLLAVSFCIVLILFY